MGYGIRAVQGGVVRRAILLVLAVAIAAVVASVLWGGQAELPVEAQIGTSPKLPEPRREWIPTVEIAPAKGWPEGRTPVAATGLEVTALATGLQHPRWIHVLANGDVLVAETNAPERPLEFQGLRGWYAKRTMKKAGAGVPSANRITLLRDADGDGSAEVRTVLLENLRSPFGMAQVGDSLYVANTDAIVRFSYHEGATRIDEPGNKIVDLPAGPRNHHWTKGLIASRDGTRLYVSVGSNSNVAEHGMAEEEGRAAIHEVDLASGRMRIFASGLRNANGMAFEPVSGKLWTAVNERDEIGSDLVPDYITSIVDGGFYGWPYSWFGRHVDERVEPQRPDLVATALVPDFAVGSHTGSLGLAFHENTWWPERFMRGAFVGQHGSWNRRPPSGYKVLFVPFANGRPTGQAYDVLTGFLDENGNALGRPVGVAIDRSGALLVADDVGNAVWRVSSTSGPRPARP